MMVSPSVPADENGNVAEVRFCPPGDPLSTFNNFRDASVSTPAAAWVTLRGDLLYFVDGYNHRVLPMPLT